MSGKCVEVLPLSHWNVSSEVLPRDLESVIGWIECDGWEFMAQVTFQGNSFAHDFLLGDKSVHCSRWLPIMVKELNPLRGICK